ncbi:MULTISPECIES: DUF445 domain-containing protein [unclassified Luteococcus]|uniref:DUF445 domain-containing protein n=1 Tax=unclassified Luteococcus TaxID=2639923 RepID=UPI00313D10BE
MIDAPGDAERRADLKKMRLVATGLLVLAAVLYLLTLRDVRTGWVGWVNAGSEAAMVGALADWFAVTAIFRHPMGIPLPHTALVKRRKNELGRSLQQFVTNNFLTADIFRERVRDAQVAQRIADWLQQPGNRRRALAQVVRGLRALLDRVRDEDVEGLVTDTVLPRLRQQQMSPLAGDLLADVVRDGSHQQLVDVLAKELHAWLERNPDAARHVIGERAPSWSPRWLDKQVSGFGYQQALEWSMAVRMQPAHPFRKAVDTYLARLAEDLKHDPAIMAKAEHVKERLLDNPSVGPAVVELWGSVRESITTALDDDDSTLWRRADRWLADAATQLANDPELRTRLDDRVVDVVGFLVDTYGEELATVISVTVDRWDADEASERIELFVGRDLQFIRINGTVVGCLAGLLIHAVSQLV